MNPILLITIIVFAYVSLNFSCAKAKFNDSGRTQAPSSDPLAEDANGQTPSSNGDQEGVGFDPDPNSTLPPDAYPPGSKTPNPGMAAGDNGPGYTDSPEDPFVPCASGADKDQYPVFARVYEFGLQGAFDASVPNNQVLHSLLYGFNPDLPKPDPMPPPLPEALRTYALVRDALVDLKRHNTKEKVVMSFLFDKFKAEFIEENGGQNHQDKFNYRTRFCMRNFDVSDRDWMSGFPETNENNASNLKEWFAIRAAAYFFVPADGNYEFLLRSDDGSLFQVLEKAGNGIGEIFSLSNDGVHGSSKAFTAPVTLSKNKIYIAHIRHFQGPRVKIGLQLFWKKPGDTEWEIVPTSAFRYDDKLLEPGAQRPY